MSCLHGGARDSARESAVGPAGVADLEVVTAEIVPGGGILVLLVLEDRCYEDPARLSELAVALVGFLGGGLEVQHSAVDLEVGCAELAGGLGRHPPTLRQQRRGDGAAQGRDSGLHVSFESGRPDSNRRRPAWEAGILPLNYARGVPTPPQFIREPRKAKAPGKQPPGPCGVTSHPPYGWVFLKLTKEPLYPTSVNVHPMPVGQEAPLEGNVCVQPLCSTSHTVYVPSGRPVKL